MSHQSHEALAEPGASNTTVWIAGWPRSGSTTMFEMVLAAALELNQSNGALVNSTMLLAQGGDAKGSDSSVSTSRSHFGLFEPCHWGLGNNTPPDVYDKDLQGDCGKIMDRLVNCDFSGVKFLFGWSRFSGPHTDITGINYRETNYTPQLATNSCKSSNLVVYKTVTEFGRSIDNLLPVLDTHPDLLALVPVRDPRGIYASWKARPWGVDGVNFLLDICKQHKANLMQKHPRLRRVVYERLASDPVKTMQGAFKFLGLDFGAPQLQWINQTFDSSCEGREVSDFSTCHQDSHEPQTRWKAALTQEEQQAFKDDPACREVAISYGYEL